MKRIIVTFCCFIQFIAVAATAAAATKGVVMKTLPTGQKIIISEDKSLPVTHIYAVLKSGSIWDPPEMEGITDLMGDMLMRGTQTRTREQLRDELDLLGAEIDIDVGHESITIVGQTLTRNLDPFLSIFSDVVLHPKFDSKEVEKLKREAISDLKQMRENDQALVGRFFARELFKGHPYGMSPSGKESTIPRITDKKIQEFYKKTITAENVFFAAAGDLDSQSLSQKIGEHFKSLPKGNSSSFSYPKAPKVEGKHILLIDKPARTQTQIIIGHMGIDVLNPDFFPLIVANNAFGGGFTARLMHEVRVKPQKTTWRIWNDGFSSHQRHRGYLKPDALLI
ncbi:MAG: insulinase family protein [Deltaproteobacteria bacterium]|nr:insulinase family protein [Deltaproteobacteria bacterium]